MSDGILSQEEIDSLLSGTSPAITQNQPSQPEPEPGLNINDFERDALGEIGNISMGTAATTLSTLLNRKVSITTPTVSITNRQKLQADYPLPYLVVEVKYTQGLNGSNILVMKEADASIIADLMMGGNGTSEQIDLDEIKLSAVGEAMNQMMGSATTSLSSMFNKRIDIAPPELTLVDLGKEHLELSSYFDEMVEISFKMVIQDLVNSEIMQIIPIEAVKNMMDSLMGNASPETLSEAAVEPPPARTPVPEPIKTSVPPPSLLVQEQAAASSSSADLWSQEAYNNIPSGVQRGERLAVQPVQFAPLADAGLTHTPQNIGLIMDVPLDVSVELGKTRKTIRDILELNQGSIIQLDKMAGEPVDLLVNGKLVAKGEVVVIDETYGIRITAIISPMDRVNKLQ